MRSTLPIRLDASKGIAHLGLLSRTPAWTNPVSNRTRTGGRRIPGGRKPRRTGLRRLLQCHRSSLRRLEPCRTARKSGKPPWTPLSRPGSGVCKFELLFMRLDLALFGFIAVATSREQSYRAVDLGCPGVQSRKKKTGRCQSPCCGILPDVRILPNLHCLTRMMTTMMALQSKMQDTGGEHREDCTESFFNTTPALDQAEARCGYAALASVELRQGHGACSSSYLEGDFAGSIP